MRTTMLAVASAFALMTGTAAMAQTAPGTAAPGTAPVMPAAPAEVMPGSVMGQMTADQLIGRDVVDASGASVGEVNDLMLGADGKMTSIMVDVGGFLGIGTRTVALDAASLTAQAGDDGDLVTSMSKEQIEALPAYEKVDGAWRIDAD